MKLTLTTVFVFLSFSISLKAQTSKEIYKFSEDIETKMQKDTVPWKTQVGATEYSISGNYKKALQTWDKMGAKILLLQLKTVPILKHLNLKMLKNIF